MGNKHEIGFISRTLLRIIHNIPPEDRASSNQEIFNYESSEIEEDLKRILKDFELVRLLYPRVTKYQWFYLGNFMAKNRDCELLALLKGIYIELLVKNYKYDEKGKVEFLAVLLSEKCKTESFPPSSRATRAGKVQVVSNRLADLKRDLRSLRNVRNDLGEKEELEGKQENNMMNLRVNPLSIRKENSPIEDQKQVPHGVGRTSSNKRPVFRPLITNENKNPLLKEGEPRVVFQRIDKDLGTNLSRRPLQILDTNLEKTNKMVVEPLMKIKCSPLLVEKIPLKIVQDVQKVEITIEEMKEMREMKEKKEMEEIRRVKEMKEKAILEREKFEKEMLERQMRELKEKEMQEREKNEAEERLMRERDRAVREALEQGRREREMVEREKHQKELRAAKEMEELRRMKEREALERQRREKELLEKEIEAMKERKAFEKERQEILEREIIKEKKEDIALILGPSGQIRPIIRSINNPPRSLEVIRAPFLAKKLPECPICFDVITPNTTLSLKACRHLFHSECLQQYFQTRINEKSFPITCAMDGCTSQVLESQIVEVLDQAYKEKFYSFSLKFFAEKNPNEVFCCPTPDCENLAFKDLGTKSFYCTKCSKAFCVQCKEEWHDGKTCEENKTDDVLEKQFFEYVGTKGCQKCPSCLYYIEKNEGCNHMTCRCGKEFCYSCLSDMNQCSCRQQEEGYDDYY